MNKGNQKILDTVEKTYLKTDLPNIRVGDTVRLGVEIREGEKIRVQAYEGVVISRKNSGLSQTITVRRVMQGIGIETWRDFGGTFKGVGNSFGDTSEAF